MVMFASSDGSMGYASTVVTWSTVAKARMGMGRFRMGIVGCTLVDSK